MKEEKKTVFDVLVALIAGTLIVLMFFGFTGLVFQYLWNNYIITVSSVFSAIDFITAVMLSIFFLLFIKK